MEKKNLDKKLVYKKVLTIGLPVAIENMIYALMNFIDMFMVGTENVALGLGTVAVAGLGFANQMFMIFMTSLFGMNSGGGILAAQYFGNKDYKNLKKCLGITIIIGFLFSLLFLFAGLFTPELVISIFTKDKKVIKIGAEYLKIVAWTYPLIGIGFAFNMELRAIGKTKYSFYSSFIGLLINATINYTLIFGHFGFPAMGVRGAAIATVIARIISTGYIIFIIYKLKLPIAGKINELFDLSLEFFIKVMKISLPVFIHEILWVLGASMYVVIFGRMGTDFAASVQIVKSISSLVLTLLFGLSSATAAIIGNEIGAGREEKAYDYSIILIKVAIICGILIGIFVFLFSPLLLTLMKVNPRIYLLTREIIAAEVFVIFIKAISLQLLVGILRSGGDTLWTMFVDLIPLWFIAIPITFFAGLYLGLPVAFVYLISCSDEVIKIIPCLKRLKSKKWINNLVN
ncbi:MATE family efflux transporter [Leptotrichia buccalis]